MTVPYVDPSTVQTPTVGLPLSAAWCATVRNNLETLARAPGAKVRRTATQSIPASSFTSIAFNATDLRDTDDYHSPSSNATRCTIPAGLGGWYLCTASTQVDSVSGTWTAIGQFMVNGATSERVCRIPAASADPNVIVSGSAEILLAAGDYIEWQIWQSSGAARGTAASSMSIRLVAIP